MSEHSEESGAVETEEVETSLIDALTKNAAAMSEEVEDTSVKEMPPADEGDETSSEIEAEQEQESVEDPLEPLEKWPDEVKEIFTTSNRQLQQFLLDREKDVERHLTQETQALSETKKRYESLDQVLNQYETVLKTRGIELAPHLSNAMQAYFAYQQDPVSTLKSLIQTSNLTQDQLFEDESTDPDIRALRTQLQNAEREIANLKQAPQPEETEGQAQIDAFKDAKDESGNPTHPHFESLKTVMAPFVAEGKSLQEAYDQALWTLPEHQKSQLEAERKKAVKESAEKAKEKVTKAKKAAETIPSSDVDKGNGQGDFSGWGDALSETLAKMS